MKGNGREVEEQNEEERRIIGARKHKNRYKEVEESKEIELNEKSKKGETREKKGKTNQLNRFLTLEKTEAAKKTEQDEK